MFVTGKRLLENGGVLCVGMVSGGNQSEIKYLNKIVEHSYTSGKFHFVNYK